MKTTSKARKVKAVLKILFGFALFFVGMVAGGCIVMEDCMDEAEAAREDDAENDWEDWE